MVSGVSTINERNLATIFNVLLTFFTTILGFHKKSCPKEDEEKELEQTKLILVLLLYINLMHRKLDRVI